MKMNIYSFEGKEAGALTVSDKWKEVKDAPQAIKDACVYYQAKTRRGTASTKTRSELSFSTRKPWKQKGTGRARVGSIGSPIWRKGGIVFGPKPRDFSTKLPKKVRQLAIKSVLNKKIKDKEVIIIEEIVLEKPKTKELLSNLNKLKVGRKPLIITKDNDKNIQLSVRNISGADSSRASDLNAYILLAHGKMIITKDAWAELEKKFLGEK